MHKRTFRKSFYLLSPISYLLSATLAAAEPQAIRFSTARTAPPPTRMVAEVNAAGDFTTLDAFDNVSSLKVLDIVKLTGPEAPLTYSGDLVGPYPGFSWFVSRHYAILSDMEDNSVRDALLLMELAWPHYVRTFQWRPPASDTHRQAIVLASSRSVLEDCLLHDSIHAKLRGGLTLEGFGCAYLYAGAPYQTRYILLHEGTHLYQYCVSGDTRGCYGFLLEGIADFLSSHIYSPEPRALNVNVLDRAPIHNHLADGLTDWHKLGKPSFSALLDDPWPSRGLSVLMTAFLQRDKETTAKWHLFCERIVRDMSQKDAKRTTMTAFRAIYGEPKSLDASFAKWMSSLKPTFNLLDRDFDQSAPNAFTALPPSNATARLEIQLRTAPCGRAAGAPLPEATAATTGRDVSTKRPPGRAVGASLPICRIGRSDRPEASAGFSLNGLTFAISNTWSGGCVFSASLGDKLQSTEVPVAFMRDYKSPFSIVMSVTNDAHFIMVSDTDGRIVAPTLRLVASADGHNEDTQRMTLFASGAQTHFEIPALTGNAPGATQDEPTPHPFPETTFPDFAGAVTEWEVLGPLPAAEAAMAGAIPPDEANLWAEDGTRLRWRRVAAHPETPITPPLINLNEVFGRQCNGLVAYAKAEIEADKESSATLLLGVADGVDVFLNDEKVASRKGKREWSAGNLRVEGVRLRKGRNRLVIKFIHAESTWLLSANVTESH